MTMEERIAGLQKALDLGGNTHDLEDVWEQLARGDAQLWMAPDAVIVTEVVDAPRLRELRFWLATGKLEQVIALSHDAMKWGKEVMGCRQAVLVGRKGWVRALAEEGWEHKMAVMGRIL